MMEAWLAGTFVLANGASAVSRLALRTVRRGRGLCDGAEFAEWMRTPRRSARGSPPGARGRDYVLREYTWPVVLDRVEASIEEWFPTGGARVSRAVVVGPYPPTADPPGDVTLAGSCVAGRRVTTCS